MKKTVFVLLLVALLLSLTLPVAMAGAGWEDPYPPGSAKNNENGRDPLVVIPSIAAEHAGFIGP